MSLEKAIIRLAAAVEAMNTILLQEAPQELKDCLTQLPPEVAAPTEQEQAPSPKATRGPRKKAPPAPAAPAKSVGDEPDVSREDLRELLKQVDRACGRKEVMTILARFEAQSLGEVDPGQYLLLKRDLRSALEADRDDG